MTKIKKKSTQICLIIVTTILCYGNVVLNDYSLDDHYITNNKYIFKGAYGLCDIWTHPYIETEDLNVDYRPLSLTVYAIEYIIFGKNPAISHLINLLFYIICVLLLFKLCYDVFNLEKINKLLPLLVVVLYSVHPSHTEVVTSIKNRDEIISFICIIISALFFHKSFHSQKKVFLNILLTLLFFYLSMLSKMVSLPFMATIFLWCLYNKNYKNYKIFFIQLISILLLITVHLYAFRDYFFHRTINLSENPINPLTTLSDKLGLGFNSLLFYLKFQLFPFPLRFYYGYNVIPIESIFNPMPLISLLIFTILVVLLIYSILYKKSYSYFLFSFLFCLLFYSNIFTKYTGIVSERSMFQFSFFFIAFIVLFIFNFIISKGFFYRKRAIPVLFIFVFYLISFCCLTIKRNTEWKDTNTLILHDMKYLEESALANHIAANNCAEMSLTYIRTDTVISRKWADLAIYYYKTSIDIFADETKIFYDLANTYRYALNDLKTGEKYYLMAVNKHPTYKKVYRELASLYYSSDEFNKAILYYEEAVKVEPNNPELLFYRALNMYNAKNTDQFLRLNSDLQKKYPEKQYAYLNYGTYYFNINKTDSLIYNFEKAVEFGCVNPQVIDYLHQYYTKKGDAKKASIYYNLLKNN